MGKVQIQKDNELLDFITPKRGKEGFWEVVDAIMKHLTNHPNPMVRQDMQSLIEEAKFERSIQKNEFGATADLSMRRLGLMPDKLYFAVQRIYDHHLPITQEQFEVGFFRRYPQFLIAERI